MNDSQIIQYQSKITKSVGIILLIDVIDEYQAVNT